MRPLAILCLGVGLALVIIGATTNTSQRASAATSASSYSCGDHVATTDSTDICSLAVAYLIDSLKGLQASTLYKTWAKQNSGEVSRFRKYLGLSPPNPWDPTFPLKAKEATPFGAMLRDIVSACKVLLCPSQALPPIPPASSFPDTTPPSVPTGITVTVTP